MNKNYLKFGNVVETKEGHRYLVPPIIKDRLIGLTEENNLLVEYIKEDLSNEYPKLDIMKVYKDYTMKELLWERPQELLTQEEKDYLKAVIKPLTCKVIFVRKRNWIWIKLDDATGDYISSALISNMTLKFEGLEEDEKYTLKELGLDGE